MLCGRLVVATIWPSGVVSTALVLAVPMSTPIR